MRVLSIAEEAELLRAARKGWKPAALAVRYGVTIRTVYRTIERAGQ